jgi:hypothetical protein
MRWSVACFALWILGCAVGGASPTTPPAACPDLSGSYAYPGIAGLGQICSIRWRARNDMPLPGPGGFYLSARQPFTIRVVQDQCRELSLLVMIQDSIGGDHQRQLDLSLIPEGRALQVRWGDQSLWYLRKFTPAGFRLPGQRQWMELELAQQPDGSLLYHLMHRERKSGGALNEIECRWQRVGD